jgi:hypothetical protein
MKSYSTGYFGLKSPLRHFKKKSPREGTVSDFVEIFEGLPTRCADLANFLFGPVSHTARGLTKGALSAQNVSYTRKVVEKQQINFFKLSSLK